MVATVELNDETRFVYGWLHSLYRNRIDELLEEARRLTVEGARNELDARNRELLVHFERLLGGFLDRQRKISFPQSIVDRLQDPRVSQSAIAMQILVDSRLPEIIARGAQREVTPSRDLSFRAIERQ